MPMNENVITLRFTDRAAAYQALGGLRNLSSANAEVRDAALIDRFEDGAVRVTDGIDGGVEWNAAADTRSPRYGRTTATLGTGTPIGGRHGYRRATRADGAADAFPAQPPPDGAVILAEVGEVDTETLDLLALWYGAVLERRPADPARGAPEAMEEAVGEIAA
ncbi:hypothetical protein [Streptomyces sp. NL15-2K]|uniref:hypothetical protein n=1 Tax=Streptomyces sp. NL15-2K TaxID=376149 RepID=UPI000F563062|nr:MULTISPECIES: hypothetical protein [Actinomycetes]WKX11066.1 hypothetical protein Q4V64_27575 [Kutzneria buriramensis]GCB52096.1 hypothetical protein SNL152K_9452 [Streptomyces sp. NL15-2K]